MVCLVSKGVHICDHTLKVIEKFWYHHKKVEAATLYFVPEVSGEFGLAQKPWDLQAWNETQLPCGFGFFFFLLNIGIITKHGELKLSYNVKLVIIALGGAAKKSLTALHEEYPVKI